MQARVHTYTHTRAQVLTLSFAKAFSFFLCPFFHQSVIKVIVYYTRARSLSLSHTYTHTHITHTLMYIHVHARRQKGIDTDLSKLVNHSYTKLSSLFAWEIGRLQKCGLWPEDLISCSLSVSLWRTSEWRRDTRGVSVAGQPVKWVHTR